MQVFDDILNHNMLRICGLLPKEPTQHQQQAHNRHQGSGND